MTKTGRSITVYRYDLDEEDILLMFTETNPLWYKDIIVTAIQVVPKYIMDAMKAPKMYENTTAEHALYIVTEFNIMHRNKHKRSAMIDAQLAIAKEISSILRKHVANEKNAEKKRLAEEQRASLPKDNRPISAITKTPIIPATAQEAYQEYVENVKTK